MAEDNTKPTEEIIENTEAVETPVEESATPVATEKTTTAKAGKRSEKSLKEAEEKQAKEERKAAKAEADAETESKPKQHANPTRSRLERQGKKFREAAAKIEKGKSYTLADALKLATETSPVKFDASVELHVNL